jgi:dehydrogenase/reductase SDR family protein 12
MSIYRNTVWFVKGMKEYTASGYQAAAKHFKPEDLEVDCTGKSYMITGIGIMNYGTGKLTTILWIRFERKFRSE